MNHYFCTIDRNILTTLIVYKILLAGCGLTSRHCCLDLIIVHSKDWNLYNFQYKIYAYYTIFVVDVSSLTNEYIRKAINLGIELVIYLGM